MQQAAARALDVRMTQEREAAAEWVSVWMEAAEKSKKISPSGFRQF